MLSLFALGLLASPAPGAMHLSPSLLALSSETTQAVQERANTGRTQTPVRATEQEMLRFCQSAKPKVTYRVTRVVDGDTIWVERNDKLEKLRLLSVDTEEKWNGGNNSSTSKPSTRYGEQSTGWAQGFFTVRTPDAPPIRVGLVFPGETEARDAYGRLLCHVVTEQGIDFNLLLVRRGMSPYFNKYGFSQIAHARFVEAQELARKEGLGIWDRNTNRSGKQRPYAKLMPWWEVRAQAVEDFRTKAEKQPLRYVHADDPVALQKSLDSSQDRVTVMGLVYKIYDEEDGGKTVRLRSGDRDRAIRIRVSAQDLVHMRGVDLEGSMEDFRQNYWLIEGTLKMGSRGFELGSVTPQDWSLAGKEPVLPKEAALSNR